MNWYIVFLYIIVFIALVLKLIQIYKYGLIGYSQKKIEKRQKRNQKLISFFQRAQIN